MKKPAKHISIHPIHIHLLCLFLLFPSLAQTQSHHFTSYNIGEGLPQSQVNGICQDKLGYLWFGTNGGGICRYDGVNFVSYGREEGLANNRVRDMLVDTKGNLWFCTEEGISLIHQRSGKNKPLQIINYNHNHGLASNKVLCVYEDSGGDLWFGTVNGVSRLNPQEGNDKENTFISPNMNIAGSDRAIYSIFEDSEGQLWFGGMGAIYKYASSGITTINLTPPITNIWAIHEDLSGALLLGTNVGVYTYSGTSFTKVGFSTILQNKRTRDIFTSKEGDLWFGTDNGLVRHNKGETTHYGIKQGLNTNIINNIYQDREGNMWFGTDGGGAVRYKDDKFVYFPLKEGEDLNMVLSIIESKTRQIWIATYTGLFVLDGNTVTPFLVSNIYKQFTIYCVYEDSKGNIWYGVRDYGVFRLDKRGLTQFTMNNGLISNNVISITEDSKGILWFGTDQGVCKYSGGHFTIFKKDNGFGGNNISCLFEDSKGNLWVGTDGGLCKYEPGKEKNFFNNYTLDDGLANNTVNSIIEDAKGNLWVSTDNGLSHYKNGEFTNFTTLDGLNSNFVNSLIIDNSENLWIGTNNGLDKLSLAKYYKDGESHFIHYTEDDGFTGIECERNAVCKDSEGNLWFGTIKGVIKYNPKEDKSNVTPPLVHITNLSVNFSDINWDKNIKKNKDNEETLILPYGINYLKIDFIGISLTAPEKVRYQYKLDGFDDDWMVETDQNEAIYSNLSPGSYTFMVKAKNNSGVWNEDSTILKLVIPPPFWQQAWFIILVSCALLAVIFLVFYQIFNRKVKKKALEERIANLKLNALRSQMNPHFIFNALNSIQNFINKNEEESANIYLAKFASLMRLILDNTKKSYIPLSDELKLLEIYLDLEKLRFKDKFTYTFEIAPEIDPEKYEIPSMLIQPYVENAINHGILPMTKGGLVHVDLTKDATGVLCNVRDNGIGREKAMQSKKGGMIQHKPAGISITKDRLDILNAATNTSIGVKINDLYNEDGSPAGTSVDIHIPFKEVID